MLIHYHDPERDKAIEAIMPKETIIGTVLEPMIEKTLFDTLAQCVAMELEIYRKYPKNEDSKETPKEQVKSFDPRNNETCFMGKRFKGNGHATDWQLSKYRKAIGTIPHPVWGDCTLLEIWGGDHFEEHQTMVENAFKYGMGMQATCPEIKFFVNPLFQNKKSKSFKLSEAQQQYKNDMDELLAKAMVFGVRSPKEAQKANKR